MMVLNVTRSNDLSKRILQGKASGRRKKALKGKTKEKMGRQRSGHAWTSTAVLKWQLRTVSDGVTSLSKTAVVPLKGRCNLWGK